MFAGGMPRTNRWEQGGRKTRRLAPRRLQRVDLQLAIAQHSRRVACLESLEVGFSVAFDDVQIAAVSGLEAVEQRPASSMQSRDMDLCILRMDERVARPALRPSDCQPAVGRSSAG